MIKRFGSYDKKIKRYSNSITCYINDIDRSNK